MKEALRELGKVNIKVALNRETLEMFYLSLVNYVNVRESVLAKDMLGRVADTLASGKEIVDAGFAINVDELILLVQALGEGLGCCTGRMFYGEAANAIYQYNLLLCAILEFERVGGAKMGPIRQNCKQIIRTLQTRHPGIPPNGKRLVF